MKQFDWNDIPKWVSKMFNSSAMWFFIGFLVWFIIAVVWKLGEISEPKVTKPSLIPQGIFLFGVIFALGFAVGRKFDNE